jgi:hypothetical protein
VDVRTVHVDSQWIHEKQGIFRGKHDRSYHTEESVDCCIDYIKYKRAIDLPESRHEGRLSGKGTIGRKRFIDEDNQQLEKAHASVL